MVKPEKKIQVDNIAVTIWSNIKEIKGEIKEIKNISLDKRYKDKKGEWKTTNSFNVYDLPKAIMALSKAFSELTVKEEGKGAVNLSEKVL